MAEHLVRFDIRDKPVSVPTGALLIEAARMAGIEIADLRNADLATLDVTMLVSDNAMNNGCVIGPAVTDWRRLDLGAAKCRMIVNGKVVGEGHGRDAHGHPLEALAWLANRLAKRGGAIAHADITIVCERPRIGPHVETMCARVASILGIEATRVSVKATTNERLGFIGREEGIVAYATATVRLPG